MTLDPSSSTPFKPDRAGHLRTGGLLLLSAGVIQLAGATTLVIPPAAALVPPIVQLATWGLGGALLLTAGPVLATGGRLASTRPATLGRVALVVFGANLVHAHLPRASLTTLPARRLTPLRSRPI